jgi:hypothetical protein
MENRKEEIYNLFKQNFNKREVYSHSLLRNFLESHKIFSIKNVAAYSYNRWNKGMSDIQPMLEWLNRGEYRYLGQNYPFNGIVIHHPQGGIPYKIAEWKDGFITYYNHYKDFQEWRESIDDGIKVVDLNSKVIFQTEEGKLFQKKILTDVRTNEITFEEGYSVIYFDSPLGKIIRFKTEGDRFTFGENEFIITEIS